MRVGRRWVETCQLHSLRFYGARTPPTTSQLPVSLCTPHPISPSLCFLSLQDPLPSSPSFPPRQPSSCTTGQALPQSRLAQPSLEVRLRTARAEPDSRLMLALSSCLSVFLVDLRLETKTASPQAGPEAGPGQASSSGRTPLAAPVGGH